MILVTDIDEKSNIGGKAYTLLKLNIPNTPLLRVVPARFFVDAQENSMLYEQLKQEISCVLDDEKLYAIRSSAIDEDSEKASFAGIHSSFLNVKKADAYQYVNQVYNSAFSENAIEYRKMNGLSTDDIHIAVIIQEMVNADFAGVAFSINPVNNNPDEYIIAVTEGLGEKLVDGTVSGTTYGINAGEINVSGKDILERKYLEDIVNLIDLVVSKTNSFQDIEFAIADGKVYFLQARPIATYSGINPNNRTLLLDNANIVESYFGITSPLTYTFAKDVYRDVYMAALRYGKIRKSVIDELTPSLSEMIYYYEGKIYYNMNSWYHVNSVFSSRKTTSHMETMMGVKSKTANYKRVKLNLLDMAKFAIVFVAKLIQIEKLSDSFERRFNEIVLPYYGKTITGNNEELLKLFKTIEQQVVGEFVIPIINDCAVMIYFGRLKDKAKELGISDEELNKYISNRGDVKSVGSAVELVRIVEQIRANPEIYNDFITLDALELLKKYKTDSPISAQLSKYVFEYGARVGDELKLETITMIEDEEILYKTIKDCLNIKSRETTSVDCVVPEKLVRLAEKTKRFIQNRERLRLKRTYVYSVVRNIFLAYGKNYCAEGRIDCETDIFYLTKEEIFSGKGDFKEFVKKRKLQEKEYEKREIYNRIVFYGEKALGVKDNKKRNGLCGIPSGGGVVKGRVRLMTSPKDKFDVGDIILTQRTDPGWVSLFPRAGGIIVEHGSMLSHSFVVAREMNLPAVVGIENATKIIPDGTMVMLDGVKGVVMIEN